MSLKGRLKDKYKLLEIDSKFYKNVPCEGEIQMPELLSPSEFKKGVPGLVLFDTKKQKLVFGPEKFGQYLKRS